MRYETIVKSLMFADDSSEGLAGDLFWRRSSPRSFDWFCPNCQGLLSGLARCPSGLASGRPPGWGRGLDNRQ